jgi:phosphoglycolate phosphatase-like HAD superfamily hydrolase
VRIFGNEDGDKNVYFRRCSNKAGRHYVLIDDHIDNLIMARQAGVDAQLAAWGYADEEMQADAERQGFAVLQMDVFCRLA